MTVIHNQILPPTIENPELLIHGLYTPSLLRIVASTDTPNGVWIGVRYSNTPVSDVRSDGAPLYGIRLTSKDTVEIARTLMHLAGEPE